MPKRHTRPKDRRAGFSSAKLGRLAAAVLAGLLLAWAVVSLFALVAPELMAPANAQPQWQTILTASPVFGSETVAKV